MDILRPARSAGQVAPSTMPPRAISCWYVEAVAKRAHGQGEPTGAPRPFRAAPGRPSPVLSRSPEPPLAESSSVALAAAPIPSTADISRAEKLVRERFLHQGEDAAVALAPGTPRRRALDEALAELAEDPKAKHPSTRWRRQWSLLLGLERLMSEEEPCLVDGTVLSAHQVDALSGTLTALLAEAQRAAPGANGRAPDSASPELLASADILGPEDLD